MKETYASPQSMAEEEKQNDEHSRRMLFARQRAAQAWCTKKTERFVMIPELVEAFAEILVEEMYAARLGCATTGEMLDEIKARVDCTYTTIASK